MSAPDMNLCPIYSATSLTDVEYLLVLDSREQLDMKPFKSSCHPSDFIS